MSERRPSPRPDGPLGIGDWKSDDSAGGTSSGGGPTNPPPPASGSGAGADGGKGPGWLATFFQHRWARLIPILLVLVLIVAIGGITLFRPDTDRRITAHFTQTVGVYAGSDVRVLGVRVGEITDVKPQGGSVRVQMTVERQYRIPSGAVAVVVPPTLVSDRYIQLSPAYTGGPTLADGADLPLKRTAVPVELDDLYHSLNDLNTALGPDGANRDGALSRLLSVGRQNLDGRGGQINTTTNNLSQAVRTLADNRGDLFGSLVNIQQFVSALAASDAQVRQFNTQLATVGNQLNGERAELAAALQSLSIALVVVANFVRQNRALVASDVRGLTQITGILVKQKQALGEVLQIAPVALSNLTLTYNPTSGTLDTRDDAISGLDPALLACSQLRLAGKLDPGSAIFTTCVQLVQQLTRCGTGLVPEILKPLAILPPVRALPCSGPTLPGGTADGAGGPNGAGTNPGTDPAKPGAPPGVGLTPPGAGPVTRADETAPIDRTVGGVLLGGA